MLHLSNFYKTATSIPLYNIEKGYTYLLPDQKKKPKSGAGDSSARTSRAASPVAADSASQTSTTRQQHKDTSNNLQDDDVEISRSFNLTLSYGDEFMDENPLVGEPGSFKLSSTGRTIRAKEAKEKAVETARELAKSEAAAESQRASMAPSPVVATAPPPPTVPAIKTNVERKGSAVGKGKSPTSASSGGESAKRRRKSKAPVTPGLVSPP
jgi:mediator of RNA polymerase II transcription subunit 6